MLIFSSMTMLVIEHDGAIQIKSVEENIQKVGIIQVTVTNEQDGGEASLYCYKLTRWGNMFQLLLQNM